MNNEQYVETYLKGQSYHWEPNASLADRSTFRIGGTADYLALPETAEQICTLILYLRSAGVRYQVIGNGSNLLFSDKGFRGVVISTVAMTGLRIEGHILEADCGVSLSRLALAAQKEGLRGLEFAYGIPGSCGGAICMNGGAFGGEIKDVLLDARVFFPESGEIRTLTAQEQDFAYRHSIYQETSLIALSARFLLEEGDRSQIRALMEEHMQYRIERQPLDRPSAGSVFKRYPGYYTSKLIDEAGLKGKRVGDAMVSPKHAGFIVNCGHATSDDVKALIEIIQEEIYRLHGIHIECEVKMIEA